MAARLVTGELWSDDSKPDVVREIHKTFIIIIIIYYYALNEWNYATIVITFLSLLSLADVSDFLTLEDFVY